MKSGSAKDIGGAALGSKATAQTEGARRTGATPAPRRSPGRPSLSKEELLDKALDVFLEHGFERTSIDAITAAAGVAKRTVYLRYGDKKSLFKAALERAIEEWIVPIETLRAVETDDLEQTLVSVARLLVANVTSPAGIRLLRITNSESGHMPEIGAFTYEQGTARTTAYLADLFHRRLGPHGHSATSCASAASAFLQLVCGPSTTMAWGVEIDEEAIERHTLYCVRLFLRGLLHVDGARPARSASDDIEAADAFEARNLRDENRRLRKLLVSAMLETASLREAQKN